MSFADVPTWASWRHSGLREGFEVAFFDRYDGGLRIRGVTSAVESSAAWRVEYQLDVDGSWRTRAAVVRSLTGTGETSLRLDSDGSGNWYVNGEAEIHLNGCVDVDLESSALTNMLPVHRLGLNVGDAAAVPAAYVRIDSGVQRLDQHYRRDAGEVDELVYQYSAPVFDFTAQLHFARDGLVNDYPGIAQRHR